MYELLPIRMQKLWKKLETSYVHRRTPRQIKKFNPKHYRGQRMAFILNKTDNKELVEIILGNKPFNDRLTAFGYLHEKMTGEYFDFPALIAQNKVKQNRKLVKTMLNIRKDVRQKDHTYKKLTKYVSEIYASVLGSTHYSDSSWRKFFKDIPEQEINDHVTQIVVEKAMTRGWWYELEAMGVTNESLAKSLKKMKRNDELRHATSAMSSLLFLQGLFTGFPAPPIFTRHGYDEFVKVTDQDLDDFFNLARFSACH
jgi:hypothetical protein